MSRGGGSTSEWARENPTVPEFRGGVARCNDLIGLVLTQTGKTDRALTAYKQARAILERLVRESPTVTAFQSELAVNHDNTGELLRATGKPAEAIEAYEQARGIQERLARENPADPEYQRLLAVIHQHIGALLRDVGRPSGALAAFEQARAIQERLVRENTTVASFQTELAVSHEGTGGCSARAENRPKLLRLFIRHGRSTSGWHERAQPSLSSRAALPWRNTIRVWCSVTSTSRPKRLRSMKGRGPSESG